MHATSWLYRLTNLIVVRKREIYTKKREKEWETETQRRVQDYSRGGGKNLQQQKSVFGEYTRSDLPPPPRHPWPPSEKIFVLVNSCAKRKISALAPLLRKMILRQGPDFRIKNNFKVIFMYFKHVFRLFCQICSLKLRFGGCQVPPPPWVRPCRERHRSTERDREKGNEKSG